MSSFAATTFPQPTGRPRLLCSMAKTNSAPGWNCAATGFGEGPARRSSCPAATVSCGKTGFRISATRNHRPSGRRRFQSAAPRLVLGLALFWRAIGLAKRTWLCASRAACHCKCKTTCSRSARSALPSSSTFPMPAKMSGRTTSSTVARHCSCPVRPLTSRTACSRRRLSGRATETSRLPPPPPPGWDSSAVTLALVVSGFF